MKQFSLSEMELRLPERKTRSFILMVVSLLAIGYLTFSTIYTVINNQYSSNISATTNTKTLSFTQIEFNEVLEGKDYLIKLKDNPEDVYIACPTFASDGIRMNRVWFVRKVSGSKSRLFLGEEDMFGTMMKDSEIEIVYNI